MPIVYQSEAYAARVNTASDYIAKGRATSRIFDTCFEMYDGDAVAVAVYRRARKNPRIRRNIWRYLGRATLVQLAFKERRRNRGDLAQWAADLREQAEYARREAMQKYQDSQSARA